MNLCKTIIVFTYIITIIAYILSCILPFNYTDIYANNNKEITNVTISNSNVVSLEGELWYKDDVYYKDLYIIYFLITAIMFLIMSLLFVNMKNNLKKNILKQTIIFICFTIILVWMSNFLLSDITDVNYTEIDSNDNWHYAHNKIKTLNKEIELNCEEIQIYKTINGFHYTTNINCASSYLPKLNTSNIICCGTKNSIVDIPNDSKYISILLKYGALFSSCLLLLITCCLTNIYKYNKQKTHNENYISDEEIEIR